MAYRFLLEVPEALYAQANVVISHTPDAGIVDVHDGIVGDFDNDGQTLTLSAQTLDVVSRIGEWYDQVVATTPGAGAVNFLLTNGRRMPVGTIDDAEVVNAIRHDQPWVERSIPKIGEHMTRTAPTGTLKPAVSSTDMKAAGLGTLPSISNITILATDDPTDHQAITVDDVTMYHLEVIDLANPERTYGEIFGAALVDRADRTANGEYIWHGAGYDFEQEAQFGSEPDFAFLQNGPLVIALERMGRGLPLDVFANPPAPIRLLVDDASLAAIRGNVLTRSWNVFDDSVPGIFVFRDPMGYTWAIHGESAEKEAAANA